MTPANELRRLLIEAAELSENPEAIARAKALPVMPELKKIEYRAFIPDPDQLRKEGLL